MIETIKRYSLFIVAILSFVVGGLFGWRVQLAKPVHEAAAHAQRQKDGSLVLARTEGTTTPTAAPHAIPKGATEERRVQVVVQPPRGVVAQTDKESLAVGDHIADAGKMIDDSCDCPPVTVDLSLVRMQDKTRRVIASSPDGKILSGLDIPIETTTPKIPRVPPWAVGVTISADRKFGGFLDRDLGPFRLGVEAFQSTNGWTAQARAGIRF